MASETLKSHTQISPSAPLGYDSVGREYWLLSVQEVTDALYTRHNYDPSSPLLHFSPIHTIH